MQRSPHADPQAPADDERVNDEPRADDDGRESAAEPEFGGRKGPDPTRYGDWEKNGRCIDF